MTKSKSVASHAQEIEPLSEQRGCKQNSIQRWFKAAKDKPNEKPKIKPSGEDNDKPLDTRKSLATNFEEIQPYFSPNIPSKRKTKWKPDSLSSNIHKTEEEEEESDDSTVAYSTPDKSSDEKDDDDEMMMSSSRRGRRIKKVNYFEDDDDDENESSEDGIELNEEDEDEEEADSSDAVMDDENEREVRRSPRKRKSTNEEEKKEDTQVEGVASSKRIKSDSLSNKRRDIRAFFSSGAAAGSKNKNKNKKSQAKATKKRRKQKDDDSDAYVEEVDEESDDDEVVSLFADESESNLDSDEEEEEYEVSATRKMSKTNKGKRAGSTTSKTTKSSARAKSASKGKDKATPEEGVTKKSMADSFEPATAPTYKNLSLEQIQKNKSFLDPCGMEATDDIIDNLIGDQVDKIGGLLQRSMANGGFGTAANLLKLGTACSGTDAPALALTLIQEQMELRGLKKKSEGDSEKGKERLEFVHAFSCENEPFKQAYLARNFDSELYPDITKLVDDPPVDVFGKKVPIPPFNMFVAGTSCKNFSMQISHARKDIEDRGCSGETFMGAVEFLFKEQPPFAIFENVKNAPWEKMQDYITGK